jgi:hypothetical protein
MRHVSNGEVQTNQPRSNVIGLRLNEARFAQFVQDPAASRDLDFPKASQPGLR